MAFIRKRVNKRKLASGIIKKYQYYQLVEALRRNNGKTTVCVLYHIGKVGNPLEIPRHVIRKYRISQENLRTIRSKYPALKVTK